MGVQNNSIVTDADTEVLDSQITQISNDFSETQYFDSEQEEELEMLVAKAMKLGELYERKKWQAAKAQSVPEGFVLINASDRNQEMLELIDQRDYMESQAEELKDKLQALYGVDFGEHSNCNFPFQNAIDYDDSDLVLVPKEPTLSMQRAGSAEAIKPNLGIASMRDIYKAMIEAQEPTND